MTLSSATINKLNKMNRAAQDASLGTVMAGLETGAVTSGSYTAVTADATGSKITIAFDETGFVGHMVQGYRSGSPLSGLKVINSGSKLDITSTGSSTWIINAGDVINYIAY